MTTLITLVFETLVRFSVGKGLDRLIGKAAVKKREDAIDGSEILLVSSSVS